MAQLISGLDAVYAKSRRNSSWQDTTVLPNLLLHLFGPIEASETLVPYLDIANQPYHRESMKGQTADVPNLLFLYKVPNINLSLFTPDDVTSGNPICHRESMKGQTADIPNFLVVSAIFNPSAGQPGSVVINPVFNKHPVQDTAMPRNPVLDILSANLPFPSPIFESEQGYRHDSLSGQYGRSGAIIPLGVPPAFNEIYTFVSRLKTAQEPYLFPNVVIRGIPATPLPFVNQQYEDHQWRGKKTQETYTYPNILAINKPVTNPFIQRQSEDLQWKAHPAQEPFVYPNILIRDLPPNFIFPFVQSSFDHNHLRGPKTQEHYDFPNGIIYWITPITPPPPPTPTGPVMPELVGLNIWEAIEALETAGVYVPAKIGYFGTFPISVMWQPQLPKSPVDLAQDFIVTAQSLAAGLQAQVNQPILLTVYEPATGVAFP